MRKAINIQPGDTIADFGLVSEVQVSHRDVANVDKPKAKVDPVKLPRYINALVRARLAQAAVEECYIQEPRLVTIINGDKSMKLKPDALVSVVEPLREAA